MISPISVAVAGCVALSCGSATSRERSALKATQSDTAWPILTTYPLLDTSRVVQLPGDTFQLFRTDITLRFRIGVSDSARRVFFNRHSMIVVGVTRSGQFFVRIPDPGPSAQNLFDALDALRSEPDIGIVSIIPRTPLPQSHF